MNVGLVLVFVISASTLAVLDARITRTTTIRPLRVQISGVCTKTVLDRQPHTQVSTMRVSKRCSNNKNLTCWSTFSYLSYESGTKTKLVQVCCPGFRKSGDKCVPICTVPCENGLCTQPNFCTCYPSYRKISEYRCAPICNDCHHGICILPNVCNCFLNYERHKNGTCVPVCKPQCINSDCTSPDMCSCHEGYQPSKSYKNICTPICNLPCGKGGICHEPDVCLCARNYRVNETNQCEPICNTCENGVCIDPGICECNKNYRLVRNVWNKTRCETMMTTSAEPFELQILFGSEYDTLSTVDDESFDYETATDSDSEPKQLTIEGDPNELEMRLAYQTESIRDYDSEERETRFDYETKTTSNGDSAEIRSDYDEMPKAILEYFTTEWFNSYQTTLEPTEKDSWVEETNRCTTQCINGNCVDDYCLCNDGYYDSELIPNQCDPICEFGSIEGCINGTCVAPNTCECYDDFIAINDYVCIPVVNNSDLLLVDHNRFGNTETTIKNLRRHLLYWGLSTLIVLALATLVIFIVYKYFTRRRSYRLHRTKGLQYDAQYLADEDGCDL